MKTTLLFVIVLIIFSCNSPNKKEATEKSEEVNSEKPETTSIRAKVSIEDSCISLVDTLTEIITLRNNIKITTKNLNRMVIWVYANPSETKIKYYWVKVGEDNGDNIATLYNFYVDPKHDEVLYYDVVGDTLITLEEWRKRIYILRW